MTDTSRYPPVEIPDTDIISLPIPSGGYRQFVCRRGVYLLADNIRHGLVPDWRDNSAAVSDMSCRDDDVFVCAFPKAGTHWIWEIATMLLHGRSEYTPVSKVTSMLEFNTPSELDRLTSPRVLNSHLPYKLLPSEAVRKGAKIIFVQRNPKDIAVSFFNMVSQKKISFAGNFNDWIQLFLLQPGYPKNWFDYTLEWEQVMKEERRLNLHMIYYENLKRNPIEEIARLSRFLGSSTDRTFIGEVANKCSFRNLRKANSDVKDLSVLQGEKTMFDSVFRKGEIGDWKSWFTVAQNELFDKVYRERMKNCSFVYQYNG
ncbi:sulfotransferase family cytosolic 1B member 1-like [Mizuhopecten yessoensis]|uniref:Sulfotransferase 1C4 n=1 Tax=Mizuhopecten yessoensis TaxID=6573 RepID=A0A210PZ53_MIZYE|nr:sulfotransferase family cytosolic 1B member 1-like [Mizuhopecten yessoensis]OWF41770.1 Sulfotransferase 1C4 [Mizuhopecten yessoensis]